MGVGARLAGGTGECEREMGESRDAILEFGAAAEACGLEALAVAESVAEAMVCFSELTPDCAELTSAVAKFKLELLDPVLPVERAFEPILALSEYP